MDLCAIFTEQVARLCLDMLPLKSGGPRIQGDIQFQLTSEVDSATPVFTLTLQKGFVILTIIFFTRVAIVDMALWEDTRIVP